MEIQILELKKLPKEVQRGEDIAAWMKFFSGKSREEFENMAKTNEYIDEAYSTLLKLSADDVKRLEYEAREKAIRDYNWEMKTAERRGEQRVKNVFKLEKQGKSMEEIAEICDWAMEEVKEILE